MADLNHPKRLAAIDGVATSRLPDPQLDALINGVAAVASTPIALVSIVRESVQFFRAYVGLFGDLSESRVTASCDSFCQFVVKGEAPFLVSDAAADARVPQALVARYGIRAYAGVPLMYQGQIIGSVCAIDVKPREFSELQIEAMRGLSGYIAQRLESLRLESLRLEGLQQGVDAAPPDLETTP
ncbi:MAG: GAF domain-containing protein [Clostridia bacterium]|nr:GAF domain-containing protein [Deltaproteobacteria bacterium]